MKTCRTCGREVGSWKYCKYCGTKLDKRDLSFQKTNTLLRQNVVLSDNIGNNESDSDLSLGVPAKSVNGQQPVDTIELHDIKEAVGDTRKTSEQPILDEAPIVEDVTTNIVSDESSSDRMDLGAGNSATKYSFKAEDDIVVQESPNPNISSEDEALKADIRDDAEFLNDGYSTDEQSTVTNHMEESMMTETDVELVLPDEFVASDTENTVDNGFMQISEEASPMIDESKAEPSDNNGSELPLDLGSLFNFTKLQEKDSETESESAVREIMPNHTQNEMTEVVDEIPVIEVESSDEIGVTTNDEAEMNDGIPIKDTTYQKEEMDGFSRVDFESVDTTTDGFEAFDVDTVKSDAVVEESSASFEEEPSVVESDCVSPTQENHEAEQMSKSFEKTTSAESPRISVLDIDPMFGSAPTFDIDSIKASFQPVVSSDKKKTKKGLFNRRKK